MEGDEPQVRKGRPQHRIGRILAIEPAQERSHLILDARRVGGLIVNARLAGGSRDDPHGPGAAIAQLCDADLRQAAAAARKQRGVPVEESCLRELCVALLDGYSPQRRRVRVASRVPRPATR